MPNHAMAPAHLSCSSFIKSLSGIRNLDSSKYSSEKSKTNIVDVDDNDISDDALSNQNKSLKIFENDFKFFMEKKKSVKFEKSAKLQKVSSEHISVLL